MNRVASSVRLPGVEVPAWPSFFPRTNFFVKMSSWQRRGNLLSTTICFKFKNFEIVFYCKTLCVFFIVYCIVFQHKNNTLSCHKKKSKPNFLLSWLSGDTVLLNLLKFGGCFDLVRADPTDQTQYLRSVFSVLVTGSFENSVSFPCRCREQVFCCFISHLLKSDWACWCMCCGCPVALLTST